MTGLDATLYDYVRSSAAYRVRIALALKGLAPKATVDIDLTTDIQSGPAYRKIAPGGLVPALEVGGQSFSQSLAIIEWLDATGPAPRLVPADPLAACAAREIALSIACDIHPLNNRRVLNYLRGPLGQGEPALQDWYVHWVHAGFAGIEQLIARHGAEGPFCLGPEVSIADVCLVPQVFNARRFEVDLTYFPRICAVNDHCLTLPAFRQAAP